MYLFAHIGKPASKLQQKFRDMLYQFAFDFTFMGLITYGQKIKNIRVLQDFLCHVRLQLRQTVFEVTDLEGINLAGVKLGFNLYLQHSP